MNKGKSMNLSETHMGQKSIHLLGIKMELGFGKFRRTSAVELGLGEEDATEVTRCVQGQNSSVRRFSLGPQKVHSISTLSSVSGALKISYSMTIRERNMKKPRPTLIRQLLYC